MKDEPQSEWARYAYGYSDKRPTFIGTWLPLLLLVGAAIVKVWWFG